MEDNEKHEDTEEDTSTVDLDSYTVISSQAKLMSGQEEEEVAAGQVSDNIMWCWGVQVMMLFTYHYVMTGH